jgi:hypothetical protein
MNIRGWDELNAGGAELDRAFEHDAFEVLYDVLGPARVRGVKDLDMFWISSVDTKAPPSRVLDIRYFPAKRKVTCRLMLAPVGGAKGRALRYLKDMERLTLEVLVGIEARLAKSGITVDLARTRAAVTRAYATLPR